MKIRKKIGYSVVINANTNVVTITKRKSKWVSKMQCMSCGIRIFDCTFNEAVHNLKQLKELNFYIHKRK